MAPGKRGFYTSDQHRHDIEPLPNHRDLACYERWASATERLLVEKGILSTVEIAEGAARRPPPPLGQRLAARFAPGDTVRVRPGAKPGHVRTPGHLKGKTGEVERVLGASPNPEDLAYALSGEPELVPYKIGFPQGALWLYYEGPAEDRLYADVYEHWLKPGGPR